MSTYNFGSEIYRKKHVNTPQQQCKSVTLLTSSANQNLALQALTDDLEPIK